MSILFSGQHDSLSGVVALSLVSCFFQKHFCPSYFNRVWDIVWIPNDLPSFNNDILPFGQVSGYLTITSFGLVEFAVVCTAFKKGHGD
jgi:hypothetical protein